MSDVYSTLDEKNRISLLAMSVLICALAILLLLHANRVNAKLDVICEQVECVEVE